MKTWFQSKRISTMLAFIIGVTLAWTISAQLMGSQVSAVTNERDVAEALLDVTRDQVTKLEESNGLLRSELDEEKDARTRAQTVLSSLKKRLREAQAQQDAAVTSPGVSSAVEKVLCDPGGCASSFYTPNPAYATYCDPRTTTFASDGQCHTGE